MSLSSLCGISFSKQTLAHRWGKWSGTRSRRFDDRWGKCKRYRGRRWGFQRLLGGKQRWGPTLASSANSAGALEKTEAETHLIGKRFLSGGDERDLGWGRAERWTRGSEVKRGQGQSAAGKWNTGEVWNLGHLQAEHKNAIGHKRTFRFTVLRNQWVAMKGHQLKNNLSPRLPLAAWM